MKDKIFCLLEGVIDLGIIKNLQEIHDCDFFALIDTNKFVKKLFMEQKMIKFQKVWYFRDYLQSFNEKPDLKYLAAFERKYKINLWIYGMVKDTANGDLSLKNAGFFQFVIVAATCFFLMWNFYRRSL